jgi:cytoskeleton protein RodZ
VAAVAVAPRIGIGPALRKARLLRGKSVEEASRETRIRADYLRALEGERFDELLGDVYVRGFLRTYSTYLGLDADKVLVAYNERVGPHGPTLPEAQPAPPQQPKSPHPNLPAIVRRHPSWTFMVAVALLVLGVFAAVGLLSRTPPDGGAASPAAPVTTDIPVLPPEVTVGIQAVKRVEVRIVVDGAAPQTFVLKPGELRSFEGSTRIDLELDRGARAKLTVNGRRIGAPGVEDAPFVVIYGPNQFRGAPSPSGG